MTMKYKKTLGPVSAKFIGTLKSEGRAIFSLKDVQKLTDKAPKEAASFINDLSKRDIVARIKAGVYLLLETSLESAQLSNWPLIAKTLVGDDNYYLSHYAAMRIHGMTTHALIEITITSTKRHRAKKINNINYKFIFSKKENFWGSESKWVSKQLQIDVSDLERTIFDCLNKPNYCGGITEVIRGIWLIQNKIDWVKLAQYAERYHSVAAVKRLGHILESLNLGIKQLPKLQAIIHSAKDYVLLDPQGDKIGKYLQKWHLRLNIVNIKNRL